MAPVGNVGKTSEEFIWLIPRFISLSMEPDICENSHTFSFAGESWYMSIYPNGETKCNKVEHIGLYLARCRSGLPIILEYTFSLRTMKGEKFKEEHCTYNFTEAKKKYGICNYIKRQQLFKKKSELLPADILTVICTMKHPKPMENKDEDTTAQCSYCKVSMNSENILSHEKRCIYRPIICPECSEVVCIESWKGHQCDTTKAEDETINIQCPETTSLATQEKLPLITSRKCPECSAVVDSGKLHDHKCLMARAEDETITIQRPETTSLTIQKKSPLITPRKCPDCSAVVDSGKLYDHKCLMERAEDETINNQCPETTSLATQEKSPLTTSRNSSECSAVVDSGELYDHKCLVTRAEAIEKLLRDLKRLMLSGDHSDTKLRVQMEEFRLHKCILSIRNPSFEMMFKKELRQQTADTVHITDCEPEQFRSLIHYIYTGTVDKLTLENVCNLYEIADRYREEQLKAGCLQFMMNTISLDNFCDIITMALKNNEQQLLKAAVEFFPCKAREIIRSVKWKSFIKIYPEQADELFMKALDYDNK